jgi:hypothetical protein
VTVTADGPRRPPAKCHRCQVNRVAWVKPRVDYCYQCLPGGPFIAPTCRACGSENYFSEGLCPRCHPGGPLYLGSCRGCLAWGVYRAHSWLCWVCRWWQTHYPLGVCLYCGRETRVGDRGACRLCLEQARSVQEPGRALDLADANRQGQQLFFANMAIAARKTPRLTPDHRDEADGFEPRQEALFDIDPDPAVVRKRALAKGHQLRSYCDAIVREHAMKYGWSKRQRNDVTRSLRLLQVLQQTPDGKIRATDVTELPIHGGNITSTIDVLAEAGLLIDDRPSHVARFFAGKTANLPEPMTQQLEVWLEVMLNGSTQQPRRRSRDPQTARLHIMGIAPIIEAWAAAGHQSFAEITAEQVRAALPASGSRRNWAEYGLKSLFTVLKGKKLIFANPTRGLRATRVNVSVPLPLDAGIVREELNSSKPGVALSVALVAFHALTDNQLRELKLTDVVDGRLTLDGRTIPLADPVRVRLAAWLDHRARTWPNTLNEHLLINQRTAPRLLPIGRGYWQRTNLRPQALREDRILQEIHATGGDVRRICDLFGLSVEASMRYAATLGHPDPQTTRASVPRTQDSK